MNLLPFAALTVQPTFKNVLERNYKNETVYVRREVKSENIIVGASIEKYLSLHNAVARVLARRHIGFRFQFFGVHTQFAPISIKPLATFIAFGRRIGLWHARSSFFNNVTALSLALPVRSGYRGR